MWGLATACSAGARRSRPRRTAARRPSSAAAAPVRVRACVASENTGKMPPTTNNAVREAFRKERAVRWAAVKLGVHVLHLLREKKVLDGPLTQEQHAITMYWCLCIAAFDHEQTDMLGKIVKPAELNASGVQNDIVLMMVKEMLERCRRESATFAFSL